MKEELLSWALDLDLSAKQEVLAEYLNIKYDENADLDEVNELLESWIDDLDNDAVKRLHYEYTGMTIETATLFNGKKVKEGDRVLFINSDGYKCYDIIRRRKFDCVHPDTGEKLKKGTLYFWNSRFNPSDYKSADVVL